MTDSDFPLSEQQEFAKIGLDEFGDSGACFVLKGYAGTGKTTVITRWVSEARKRPADMPEGKFWRAPRIVLTAPTNKATNVLSEKAAEIRLPVDTSTVHSLLSLKMKWEKDQQILVPDPRGEDKFSEYDYVVVDECSMLNEELMKYILAARERANNKVIFMGDPCQLPPVGEKESGSFNMVRDPFELTQIMRQAAGSNILPFATYLRELILSPKPGYPSKIFQFVDDKSIIHLPVQNFEDEIMNAFMTAEEKQKDIRHLAWTNKVVDAWNDKIRDRLYGFDREEWTKGEAIVTTAPVVEFQTGDILFTTDTLLTIQNEPEEIVMKDVPCWKLKCRSRFIYVPMRSSTRAFNNKKEELVSAATQDRRKWPEFYEFIETFARVKPAHSLTVHRSQGSTFDDVYVSYQNILKNPRRKESLQCLYVAVTRPRGKLFLV